MQASLLDTLTRSTSAMLISGYQKYLSPHKGFSCAHRVWHRGESCSQYTKRAIVERGLISAFPLVRERFQECKVANDRLQQRRQALQNTCRHSRVSSLSDALARIDSSEEDVESTDERGRKQKKSSAPTGSSSDSCNGCGLEYCGDCGLGSVDCSAIHCPSIDCAGMDCTGSHCGAIDCAGLDCAGLDCGGCDGFSSCSW
jgi:putative component of membrane protein insertase Oxa1/YidC/SpoIIIJ protein YidD